MKYARTTLRLCAIVAGVFVVAVAAQLTGKPGDTHADTARTVCARVVLDSTPGGAVWVDRGRWPATRTGYVWRVKVAYETTHGEFIKTYNLRDCTATQMPSGRWRVELQP